MLGWRGDSARQSLGPGSSPATPRAFVLPRGSRWFTTTSLSLAAGSKGGRRGAFFLPGTGTGLYTRRRMQLVRCLPPASWEDVSRMPSRRGSLGGGAVLLNVPSRDAATRSAVSRRPPAAPLAWPRPLLALPQTPLWAGASPCLLRPPSHLLQGGPPMFLAFLARLVAGFREDTK